MAFRRYTPRAAADPAQLESEARQWCARAERSARQVQQKLQQLGLPAALQEACLARLQEEGYQDDARFAQAYVRDHFRLQGWGRRKIRQGLQLAGVPESLAQAALADCLDEETYQQTLESLATRRADCSAAALPSLPLETRQRLERFLLQRGFEPDRIAALWRRR